MPPHTFGASPRGATRSGLTLDDVERIWRTSKELTGNHNTEKARRAREVGMRMARGNSANLRRTLESCLEHVAHLQEVQMGRTQRAPDTPHGYKGNTGPVEWFREAHLAFERPDGNFEPFAYIYGALAVFLGYA